MQGFFGLKKLQIHIRCAYLTSALTFSIRKGMRLLSFSVKVSKTAFRSINEKFSHWSELCSTAIDFCSLFCHLDLELSISYWLKNRKSIICILLRACENWIYLHIHWHFTMKFWACNKAASSYSAYEKFMIMKDNFWHNYFRD